MDRSLILVITLVVTGVVVLLTGIVLVCQARLDEAIRLVGVGSVLVAAGNVVSCIASIKTEE